MIPRQLSKAAENLAEHLKPNQMASNPVIMHEIILQTHTPHDSNTTVLIQELAIHISEGESGTCAVVLLLPDYCLSSYHILEELIPYIFTAVYIRE